jgi:polyphosphate kinase
LEEAGVHVVYGLVGYKIHSKLCLIVRREETGIRRYVHLSTGNYNPTTARIYTDLSLFTCKTDYGEDVTNLFNLLTGICQFQPLRKLIVAPFELHERIIALIHRETANARKGLPARIVAKMNSLVDEKTIEALYEASEAGVQIELIVRGICCLRPGLRGLSANITVRSIVDRFLEHSRVFYFENACQQEVYISSADWMPRNFFRRIEIAFPIEDGKIRERIINEIMGLTLADNLKARVLDADGEYHPLKPAAHARMHRSQLEFISLVNKGEHPAQARGKKRYPRVKLAPKPSNGSK